MASLYIVHVIYPFLELSRATKSAWDFLGVTFWSRDILGFAGNPRVFFGSWLLVPFVRSSPALEIPSTPPPPPPPGVEHSHHNHSSITYWVSCSFMGCLTFVRRDQLEWLSNNGMGFCKISKPTEREVATNNPFFLEPWGETDLEIPFLTCRKKGICEGSPWFLNGFFW